MLPHRWTLTSESFLGHTPPRFSDLNASEGLLRKGVDDDHSLESDILMHMPRRFDLPPSSVQRSWGEIGDDLWSDQRYFYSRPVWTRLGLGLGMAAIIANTQADRELIETYRESIRVEEFSSFTDVVRPLGDGTYTLPVFALASLFGRYATSGPAADVVGEWGWRSLRTFAVGAVPLVVLQRAIGAGRPDDPTNLHGSQWEPLQRDNGVSGHAFMGAIPFLSAAKMTDNPWLKGALYVGSTATAWSRLEDGRHYPSQIFLGWWLAFLAANAVDLTELDHGPLTITPGPIGDGAGLWFDWRF